MGFSGGGLRGAIEPLCPADRVKALVPQLASAAHGCLRDALHQKRARGADFAQPHATRMSRWLRETARARCPGRGVEHFRAIAAKEPVLAGPSEWERVAILWTHLFDSADTFSALGLEVPRYISVVIDGGSGGPAVLYTGPLAVGIFAVSGPGYCAAVTVRGRTRR